MKILLIEPSNAKSESIYQEVKSGVHAVDRISEKESPVSYARTGSYDLVIMNPVYASEEYITVVTKFRKRKMRVPVLFVSASSAVEARVLALDSGADDAMSRPFVTEELHARIRALGRRHTAYFGDSIELGDVVFNRRMRVLEKGGKQVALGGKEFAMMEMFALTPRQVISKEKFTDKIWGYDSDAEYNNVEVYISFLRKKLRQLDAALKIVSVRGVGYRLQWEDSDAADEWYFS